MGEAYVYTAGPARALFFYGQDLIGVGKTLNDTSISLSNTAEEIRGGPGNLLWGKYFHDSAMEISITDVMFNLQYIAASLGVNVEQGGLSMYESPKAGEIVAAGGVINLSNTAVAFDGSVIAWYKKPSDANWSVTTVSGGGKIITIPGAQVGDAYCVKYFYQNPNAKSVTIKAQYVPKVLHLVLINDLYSGDASKVAASSSKYGRLITDIPQFQLSGGQDLSWSATTAATVSINGSALAYDDGASCEEDPIYGTMTQEIFGAAWQDDVVALAIENADIDLSNGEDATLIVRVVYGGNIASQRKDNSNFTFAVEDGESFITLDQVTGKVTAKTGTGVAHVSATLKDAAGRPTTIVGIAAISVN